MMRDTIAGQIRYVGPASDNTIEVIVEPEFGSRQLIVRFRQGRRYKYGRQSRQPLAIIATAAALVAQLSDLWWGSRLIDSDN